MGLTLPDQPQPHLCACALFGVFFRPYRLVSRRTTPIQVINFCVKLHSNRPPTSHLCQIPNSVRSQSSAHRAKNSRRQATRVQTAAPVWRFESESSASTDALNARRRNRFHTDPVPHTDPIPAEFTRLHSGELRIWFLVNTFVKEQSRTRGALLGPPRRPPGATPAVSQQTRFLPAAPEPPGLPCPLLTRNPPSNPVCRLWIRTSFHHFHTLRTSTRHSARAATFPLFLLLTSNEL